MRNLKNECRLKVEGVNIDKIYKILVKNQITMTNIDRPDYKILYFNISVKHLKRVLKLIENPSYKITICEYFGTSKLFHFLKERLAIILVAILFIVSISINNFLINNIEIYGNQLVSSEQVLLELESVGVRKYAFLSNVKTDYCEEIILEKFDTIGLVSVAKIGNTIVVNIKEKTLNNLVSENEEKIVAKYSGQIISVEVFEGTSLVKEGDAFKEGDILVENYYIDNNNNKVKCRANAKIKAKIWFSHSEIFENEIEITQRTGNVISNSYLYFGDYLLDSKEKEITFSQFEQDETQKYIFKNNFFPLISKHINYYETENIVVEQDFETNKDKIINDCYEKARKKVVSGLTVSKSFDTINHIDNGYVVSAYFECETYI